MKRTLGTIVVLCLASLPARAAEPKAVFEDSFDGKLAD